MWTTVTVACSDYGQWIWEGGLNTVNASGVYGTQDTASASNVPGARYSASSWTDSSGNFWLFGGVGYDSTGGAGNLNDLWRYSPSTGQWTWISGGNADNATGVYGTQGTASAGNVPGARYAASSWIDSSGNLWLFGGYGDDSTGGVGQAQRSVAIQSEHRTSGPGSVAASTANAAGVYGTQGTASASNVPGARYAASSWIDSAGNLWLFGGYGYDSTGTVGKLNDLWQYSPSTKSGPGSAAADGDNATGVYGTQGTASAGNVPGARQAANSWIDSSGNLWLFGGYGYDSTGDLGYLNDLWQYSPSTERVDLDQWRQRGQCQRGLRHRRARPRPATCRERARRRIPGSTRPATCGCSAAMATTQPGVWAPSTICGNSVRAPRSGPRSVAAT